MSAAFYGAVDCTFCGEKRICGDWMGCGAHVFCCHQCALKVLPALLADSLVTKDFYIDGQRCWDTAAGAYWKALACRANKKG